MAWHRVCLAVQGCVTEDTPSGNGAVKVPEGTGR